MVARAYKPGCKMDNMPVLEGVSGLRKTQFLGVLGGEWYKSLSMQFGEKDFLQALRGAWLVEIPDMAGFGRAEHTKVLSTLTTSVDTYRVPYGREPEDVPRTCIFAATSETDDYLSDTRGKRRYWPLRCTDINLDALRGQRDQIFAEALHRYREGAHWYDMPESAIDEQSARAEGDEGCGPILEKADEWWIRYKISPVGAAITAKRLLVDTIGVPLGQITSAQCRRVTVILRSGGWERTKDKHGFIWIKRERL
jgi:putative DNA primase/helicase